jgi:universal stress protein A
MNIKSILFPTDFSQYNDAALHYVSVLAAETNATLHIVYVHETRDHSAAMGEASYVFASSWKDELKAVRKRLSLVRPQAPAVTYEHHCLTGIPDEEIVSFATDKCVDLIVMASHGRTGLSRLLMGSVAEAVMRKSPCPVLIVKQPTRTEQIKQQSRCATSEMRLLT